MIKERFATYSLIFLASRLVPTIIQVLCKVEDEKMPVINVGLHQGRIIGELTNDDKISKRLSCGMKKHLLIEQLLGKCRIVLQILEVSTRRKDVPSRQ